MAPGLQTTHPSPTSITLANQCTLPPLPLLIGHPWLRHAKAIHDWGTHKIWISPQGLSYKELILAGDIDPSAQEASLTIHLSSPPVAFSILVPEHSEDSALLNWLQATKSIPCLTLLIS